MLKFSPLAPPSPPPQSFSSSLKVPSTPIVFVLLERGSRAPSHRHPIIPSPSPSHPRSPSSFAFPAAVSRWSVRVPDRDDLLRREDRLEPCQASRRTRDLREGPGRDRRRRSKREELVRQSLRVRKHLVVTRMMSPSVVFFFFSSWLFPPTKPRPPQQREKQALCSSRRICFCSCVFSRAKATSWAFRSSPQGQDAQRLLTCMLFPASSCLRSNAVDRFHDEPEEERTLRSVCCARPPFLTRITPPLPRASGGYCFATNITPHPP